MKNPFFIGQTGVGQTFRRLGAAAWPGNGSAHQQNQKQGSIQQKLGLQQTVGQQQQLMQQGQTQGWQNMLPLTQQLRHTHRLPQTVLTLQRRSLPPQSSFQSSCKSPIEITLLNIVCWHGIFGVKPPTSTNICR